VSVSKHLALVAQAGVDEDGEAAVFVRVNFFFDGGVHIQEIYADRLG
jgi:hypothetical protein